VADGRSAIFAALRAAASAAVERPPRSAWAPLPGDRRTRFAERVAAAGGELVDSRGVELADTLRGLAGLATAGHVWSALPEFASRGLGTAAQRPHDAASLEVTLVRGEMGVSDCGAIWHEPGSPLERAAALLAEHLVVVLPAERVVDRLRDAYARMDGLPTSFGWLLCGPSKTADIEQALVLGAHGPRYATVVLV